MQKNVFSSLSKHFNSSSISTILEIHNRPYHISINDIITTPRLKNTNIGDILKFHSVRELSTKDYTIKGSPFISTDYYTILGTVIEHPISPELLTYRKGRKVRKKIVRSRLNYSNILIKEIKINQLPIEDSTAN